MIGFVKVMRGRLHWSASLFFNIAKIVVTLKKVLS
jgi:hypothetical protein